MKGMKKMLVLLAGLAAFLCASPVLAAEANLAIPYAQTGDGWWSGLALTNLGWSTQTVTIYRTVEKDPITGAPELKQVGQILLQPRATKTDLLEKFFTQEPYPTGDSGRVSLWIEATGGGDPSTEFRATLFMGNGDGGFGFQSFKHGD